MAFPSLPGAWGAGVQPPLLLIVREQVQPASLVAYDRVESEIRRVCQRWACPNAYIALASASSPGDVWWLTAWSSQAELDQAGALYAANSALAARLAPLNGRKRALTGEPTTILAKAAGQAPFTLAGARFVSLRPRGASARPVGALYDLPDGGRIALEPAADRPSRTAPDATLLAIQPRWSLPPDAFVAADPDFWSGRSRPR